LRIKTYLLAATLFAIVLPARVNSQSPGSAPAAQAPLPTVKGILDRYQAAIGGNAAWMVITTRTLTYFRQVDDGPAVTTLKSYAKAPDKRLFVLTLPDGSVRRDGCDGKSVWTEDAHGLREQTGVGLAMRLRHCNFYSRLQPVEFPDKARVSGIEQVEGRNAYVVEYSIVYSPDAYSKCLLYFDSDTGLLVRQDEMDSLPEGQLVQQDFYDDYRLVDGIRVPFRSRDVINGHTILLRLGEVKHNVPVDDALFIKPAK